MYAIVTCIHLFLFVRQFLHCTDKARCNWKAVYVYLLTFCCSIPRARNFSLLHNAQTCLGAGSASYSVGSGGSFPRGKVAPCEVEH